MDYRKIGDFYYLRMDRDDEIISKILEICKKEKISSAIFSGIGGCKEAEIQTYIPEEGKFELEKISGMLELASMNGNVVSDGDEYFHHTHAVFSYKNGEKHCMAAGHMKSVLKKACISAWEQRTLPLKAGTVPARLNST